MQIRDIITEQIHYVRPGELRGSYTDRQMTDMGFSKSSRGVWYIDQRRWDELIRSGVLREEDRNHIQKKPESKLVIFDIDDTLVNTDTRVNVVRDGSIIHRLDSHEFTHYKLKPGEEFDFGAFRDAEEFFRKARPIVPMINQLKRDIATGNRVIMVTARSDFNDRELFLDTFRRFGIDMSRVHVYRAGNLAVKAATEEKKKIIIKHILGEKHYDKIIMYDDAIPNLDAFLSLKQDYPWSRFYAWHMDPSGQALEYHRSDVKENPNRLDIDSIKDQTNEGDVIRNKQVCEFAPGGDFKPPAPPKKRGSGPWGDDDRSQIAQAVKKLLADGNRVDWQVPGQMGHVTRVEDHGVILRRWNRPYSKMKFLLPLTDIDDIKYQITMRAPKHYAVVDSNIELDEGDVIHTKFATKQAQQAKDKYQRQPDIADSIPLYDPERRMSVLPQHARGHEEPFDHFYADAKSERVSRIIGVTRGGKKIVASTWMAPVATVAKVADAYNRGGFSDVPMSRVPIRGYDVDESADKDANYLDQIPHLQWQPINRQVWEVIQDEGLDQEQNAPGHRNWVMAVLNISAQDAAALKQFDDTAIEAFNRFDINLKDRYPGLTDLIDYDRGTVTIVKPTSLKENFADGKIKGKSRPGRVKRAGASCKGSVSDLRARAKKYSGERGKMYHWCANMKAGKK